MTMWVLTPRGFYSAVEKPQDRGNGTLTIRTRNRADLDALIELLPSKPRPYAVKHSDYAWRVRCPRGEWLGALAVMGDEIRYSNFKDEVKRVQGPARAGVYARVWSVLFSLQDRAPARRRGRAKRQDPARLPAFDDERFDRELEDWRADR